MQTAVARQGDLTIFASGAGQVIPASEIGLGFDESGTLLFLDVVVGDKVEAGDVLAQLQTKDSVESIDASIADAELARVESPKYARRFVRQRRNRPHRGLERYRRVRPGGARCPVPAGELHHADYLQDLDAIEALDLMKAELDVASDAFEPYRYYPSSDETRAETCWKT